MKDDQSCYASSACVPFTRQASWDSAIGLTSLQVAHLHALSFVAATHLRLALVTSYTLPPAFRGRFRSL